MSAPDPTSSASDGESVPSEDTVAAEVSVDREDTTDAEAPTDRTTGSRRDTRPAPKQPRPHRLRRVLGWVGGSVLALIIGAGAGFLIWANTGVMAAEADPLAAVRADSEVELVDEGTAWVMRPTDAADGTGLVFIPGAKVAPEAYAATFQALVDDGTTVVITKPPLNLAILDLRPLSRFTELVPEISDWAVGGHSLGGVKACQLVGGAGVERLILFASYCSNDISQTGYDVLSISGSADGLSTPAKIEAAWPLLPADAAAFVLDGGSHASFGAYGPQAGDGAPTMSADEAHARISSVVHAFLTAP